MTKITTTNLQPLLIAELTNKLQRGEIDSNEFAAKVAEAMKDDNTERIMSTTTNNKRRKLVNTNKYDDMH